MRCLAVGLKFASWRCKNSVQRLGFCRQHQRWVLGAIAIPIITLVAGTYVAFWLGPSSPNETVIINSLKGLQEGHDEILSFLKEHHDQSGGGKNIPFATDLDRKYPFGFALFYYDGRRTLYYGSKSEGLAFDPAKVEVISMGPREIIFNISAEFPGARDGLRNATVRVRGNSPQSIGIGTSFRLWFEPILTSSEASSWVIGVSALEQVDRSRSRNN